MSHNVAKPKTAQGGVVEVVIGPGSLGDSNFKISVANASLGFSVQVADITADSDTVAVYTHNEMTRGTFQVQGYALTSQSRIGIHKLQSTTNGRPGTGSDAPSNTTPVGTQKYDIQFNYASGQSIYGIAIVEQIQVSYSRSSAFVGVSLSGRFTSTDLGSANVVDAGYEVPS